MRRVLSFVVLLFASFVAIPAHNTSVWVTEYVNVPIVSIYYTYPYPKTSALATYELIATATPANGAAFNIRTGLIRVAAAVAVHIAIGPSVVVTHADTIMHAGSTEYFIVTPGDRVSIIDAGP